MKNFLVSLTAITVFTGISLTPNRSSVLAQEGMPLDLHTFCKSHHHYPPLTYAELVNQDDTSDGWKCRVVKASSNPESLGRVRYVGFNTDEVCKWQYGDNAYARRINWTPSGWKCFTDRQLVGQVSFGNQ